MEQTKKYGLWTKLAVLSISLLLLAPSAISPAMGDLIAAFPEKSANQVRMLITIPMFTTILFTLVSSWLADWVDSKFLSSLGVLILTVSGVVSSQLHTYGTLVLFRLLLGVGLGLTAPFFVGFITRLFTGEECMAMIGLQSAASSLGGLLLSFVGGMLAMGGWRTTCLVYLIGAPVLLLELLFVPALPATRRTGVGENAPKAQKIPLQVLTVCLELFFYYMIMYFIYTDFTLLVFEKEIGNAASAGTGLSLVSVGGLIAGVLYGKVSRQTGKYLMPFCLLLTAAGFGLIAMAGSILPAYLGAFLTGCGCFTIMPHIYATAGMLMQGSTKAAGLVTTSINVSVFASPYAASLVFSVLGSQSERSLFLAGAALFSAAALAGGLAAAVKKAG